MEFSNKFEVPAKPEDVWVLLCDVERIAPCLPGAELTETVGDEYHGVVKVKVGPITAQYKGVAKFESKDEAARKIVLAATGRDVKGSGNARATIAVSLATPAGAEAAGGGAEVTEISVDVDLNISGKVAQFGRGVMADVNAKLMEKFAENLEQMIAGGSGEGTASGLGDGTASGSGDGTASGSANGADGQQPGGQQSSGQQQDNQQPNETQPLDLLEATGVGKVKAGLAVVGAAFVALVLFIKKKLGRKKSEQD